eukprot:scaffold14244_cov129-Isochrysis_galbana.AAC.2
MRCVRQRRTAFPFVIHKKKRKGYALSRMAHSAHAVPGGAGGSMKLTPGATAAHAFSTHRPSASCASCH